MENIAPAYLKGSMLMAVPSLADPNFQFTVTCISEHTSDGAMGLVVNRLHNDIRLKMIFDELKITCLDEVGIKPVYNGGPVHMNELFVLHGAPLEEFGGIKITDSLALSNSREIIESIARGDAPNDYLVALGCAGWGPGQLEAELAQNAWLTGACNTRVIFAVAVEERWEYAIKLLGIDPSLLTDAVGHA